MSYKREKTCFVIMPYGERKDENEKLIDFDRVYEEIIKPAVTGEPLEMKCVRSDFSHEPGSIHAEMFANIFEADVAIVDISTLNPNVLYELGVRHTARRSVTVMMGQNGIRMPFNIAGHRILEYDPFDERVYCEASETRKLLREFIASGLKNRGRTDSPIYDDLKELSVQLGAQKRIREPAVYRYPIKERQGKVVGIVTGHMLQAFGVADIWVNPENLHMKMARPYDRSISAVIRYAGAVKTIGGNIKEDVIYDELREIMARDQERYVVEGNVIYTEPGDLARTHGVRKIFHVAAARGSLGDGYAPVQNIGNCVTNVLRKADSEEFAADGLRSILIPLIGTGTSRGDLDENVPTLVDRALRHYLEGDTRLEEVLFLAWSEPEFETVRDVIRASPAVDADGGRIEPILRLPYVADATPPVIQRETDAQDRGPQSPARQPETQRRPLPRNARSKSDATGSRGARPPAGGTA